MIRLFAFLWLLFVGAICVGLLVAIFLILEHHHGMDFATRWIWIYVLLNVGGYFKHCDWTFRKLKNFK